MDRLAFFRGTAEVKGHGYQPSEDTSLPRCFLQTFLRLHFHRVLENLQDETVLKAMYTPGAAAPWPFSLRVSTPMYNGAALGDAFDVDSAFVASCTAAGRSQVKYVSQLQQGNIGMKFLVDGATGDIQSRYFVHVAPVSAAMLSGAPRLRTLLLFVLEGLLNFYCKSSVFIQGIRDSCDNPMVWRAKVREIVYAMPRESLQCAAPGIEQGVLINHLETTLRESSQRP